MRFVIALSCLCLVACGESDPSSDAGTGDAGGVDIGTDGGASDGGFDAGRDAGSAPTDAGVDAGPPSFLPSYPTTAEHPESGIYDPATHAFYVGNIADGSVRRIDAETGVETSFYVEASAIPHWTLGLDIDPTRRRLFVCTMEDLRDIGSGDPANRGYVLDFDLETGALLERIDLSTAFPDATCTDVAVAASGDVYVCDREHPNIYRIDTTGAVTLFATDPELDGGFVGQNAIVVLPDQSALLSLVYLPSRLVHVSLSDARVRNVDIDGDFFDGLPPLSGADGMTLSGGDLLVAFTSQLNRISPTLADWSTATSVTVEVPSGMTDIVHTPGGDYLLNGQAVTFALGREPDPAALVRFDGDL